MVSGFAIGDDPARTGAKEARGARCLTSSENAEWLALSSSISMLCEADLMALDEDLQAVPWGSIEAHQMSSPLTALGTRAWVAPAHPTRMA